MAKDGDVFYAADAAGERKCNGLTADVLVTLEDITKQVKDAATDKMKPAEALEKRNAAAARIEKACAEKNHTICSVVKLSSGERYDLYQYKRYADIRLVFAPEGGRGFVWRQSGGAHLSAIFPGFRVSARL